MFVKLVHKSMVDQDPVLGLYECSSAELKLGDKVKLFMSTLTGECKEFNILSGQTVFFMNLDGKTIDKFTRK